MKNVSNSNKDDNEKVVTIKYNTKKDKWSKFPKASQICQGMPPKKKKNKIRKDQKY